MSEDREERSPAIEHLNPARAGAVTESGELERPRLTRKIDCAGDPENADRRRSECRGSRGAAPPLRLHP